MTPFLFIVACLACYRLTILIARDMGPFNVFQNLRANWRVFGCVFCISVWIGFTLEALLILFGLTHLAFTAILEAFAMSAAAIILDRCFSADYNSLQ
jgi:hypothetical protein